MKNNYKKQLDQIEQIGGHYAYPQAGKRMGKLQSDLLMELLMELEFKNWKGVCEVLNHQFRRGPTLLHELEGYQSIELLKALRVSGAPAEEIATVLTQRDCPLFPEAGYRQVFTAVEEINRKIWVSEKNGRLSNDGKELRELVDDIVVKIKPKAQDLLMNMMVERVLLYREWQYDEQGISLCREFFEYIHQLLDGGHDRVAISNMLNMLLIISKEYAFMLFRRSRIVGEGEEKGVSPNVHSKAYNTYMGFFRMRENMGKSCLSNREVAVLIREMTRMRDDGSYPDLSQVLDEHSAGYDSAQGAREHRKEVKLEVPEDILEQKGIECLIGNFLYSRPVVEAKKYSDDEFNDNQESI